MATYWENSCSFGLRYVSWYKCLIVSLDFSHLGFWSGNLFLIAPFPDLCLLVPFHYSRRTQLKCMLFTGTYQGNRAAFNQCQVDPTCRIWSVSPENREHFVSECYFFQPRKISIHIPSSQLQNPEFLTQLTFDASVVLDKNRLIMTHGLLELQTREFIYKIHHKRPSVLKRLAV